MAKKKSMLVKRQAEVVIGDETYVIKEPTLGRVSSLVWLLRGPIAALQARQNDVKKAQGNDSKVLNIILEEAEKTSPDLPVEILAALSGIHKDVLVDCPFRTLPALIEAVAEVIDFGELVQTFTRLVGSIQAMRSGKKEISASSAKSTG